MTDTHGILCMRKKIYEFKQGHGWFPGYVRETDIISCIDSGMWKWHILLVEANEIIEREREREFLSRIARRWVTFGHTIRTRLTYLPGWFTTGELCSMA